MPDVPNVAPPNDSGTVRILVPGGIGDAYWVMVKLEAFMRREGISGKPQVIVLTSHEGWDESRVRSVPFLRMVPFVTVGSPEWITTDPVTPRPQCLEDIYREAGEVAGRTVWPGFMGYEYFISYNGHINSGSMLEDVDGLECNWRLPLDLPPEFDRFRDDCLEKYGRYAAFYFSSFTKEMMAKFSVRKIVKAIRLFTDRTGITPVFMGAGWDLGWGQLREIIRSVPRAVNLVGKTTLAQAIGLMDGAVLVSGYFCGLTNLALMLGKKATFIWVGESFHPNTPLAVAPPESRGTTYLPLMAEGLMARRYARVMTKLANG